MRLLSLSLYLETWCNDEQWLYPGKSSSSILVMTKVYKTGLLLNSAWAETNQWSIKSSGKCLQGSGQGAFAHRHCSQRYRLVVVKKIHVFRSYVHILHSSYWKLGQYVELCPTSHSQSNTSSTNLPSLDSGILHWVRNFSVTYIQYLTSTSQCQVSLVVHLVVIYGKTLNCSSTQE